MGEQIKAFSKLCSTAQLHAAALTVDSPACDTHRLPRYDGTGNDQRPSNPNAWSSPPSPSTWPKSSTWLRSGVTGEAPGGCNIACICRAQDIQPRVNKCVAVVSEIE